MKKSVGISLLEILLGIAVAGILLVLALRYFGSADENSRVLRAQNLVQTIMTASYQWENSEHQADFATPNSITFDDLITAGLLDESSKINPWGGDIEIGPGAIDTRYVRITFHDLPQSACQNLAQKLSGLSKAPKPTCSEDEANDYSGDF